MTKRRKQKNAQKVKKAKKENLQQKEAGKARAAEPKNEKSFRPVRILVSSFATAWSRWKKIKGRG